MIQRIIKSHHRIVWKPTELFFHCVLFGALILLLSCSSKDELVLVKKDIQQIRTELDSIKLQKEKWQDYDIKGKWDISQEFIEQYEKNYPNHNYIKRIDFYEKPYIIFSDFTQKVPIRYEVDYK